VFGFPGETTLPLYLAWHDFPGITHVLARDERSASYMANAYSRLTNRPGICEGPSVGATHMIAGVTEGFKASDPMIVFTTDIPLHLERRNMLTGFDQSSLYQAVTKESLVLRRASEAPNLIRRAFRLATAGRPGPVHVRLPMDVLEEPAECEDVYAEEDFCRCPGHRPVAQLDMIRRAVGLLASAERPLIVCGGGVLVSQAWDQVAELAEAMGIPVGTTMTGKGSITEIHPLSIGVTGGRGGTRFSNGVVAEADLIFYIGSNTDSAGTAGWTLPALDCQPTIIHLDVSEVEVGNNYRADVALIGDARATLERMVECVQSMAPQAASKNAQRVEEIQQRARAYQQYLAEMMPSDGAPVHPLRLVRALLQHLPDRHVIVADPGVSAIYPSAFHRVAKPGRSMVFNYSMGALGYAIPASVGAHYARPDHCVVALTGDGSFGLCCGELETIARTGGNIKVVLFNNGCFGWIKAALRFSYEPKYFACDFGQVDYVRIAKGFGLKAYRVADNQALDTTLGEAFGCAGPAFIEVLTASEEELVPPVPAWTRRAAELGVPHIY
jgi:acetolactate synthase-1/2/3 large subunit